MAAVLGGLVWWTPPRVVAPTAGVALLGTFAASDVRSIRVTGPDGSAASIERGPLDGVWLMSLGSTTNRAVVDGSRVQGFLRLLAELQSGDADPRPMPRASIVTLQGPSGPLATLAIDSELIAGRGRVALLDQTGKVLRVAATSEDLGGLLRADALNEWRSKVLLAWSPERSSSLLLRRGDKGVSMSRVGAGWLMSAPVQMKADPGAAQGVSLWLANAAVDRFVDDAGSPDAFAKPARTVVIATESSERRRVEQRIELGAELDARSSLIRITGVDADATESSGAARVLWGPLLAVVQTSLLAGLSDEASAYLPKTSFDFPPADVASVRVGAFTVARGADGSFGAHDATVRTTLKLLTEVPAASVTLLPAPPTPSGDAARVTLIGLGSATIGAATLEFDSIASRTEGTPSVPALRVTVDRVQRVIPLERARELLASVRAIAASN